MSYRRPLISGFQASAERYPARPAVQIKDEALSYAELYTQGQSIAATLSDAAGFLAAADKQEPLNNLTGVFGHRSFAAIAGVVGALLSGGPYVPLNPGFPEDRTLNMIRRARLRRIVVEHGSFDKFLPVLEQISTPIVVVLPDSDSIPELHAGVGQHHFISQSEMSAPQDFESVEIDPEELAYVLFTSGSTGQPKGVMVKQSNVVHFVDRMVERYGITAEDRFSQTFDLTFDLSAFDLFVAWEKGACVCIPTQGEKMLPAKYVLAQKISIWFSVPSTAIMMKKLRMLKPDAFPSIRYSLFCGEALPLEVTEAFQQAAPQSIVENLYGPTELTIACTLYRYDAALTPAESTQGVVPIGSPYPGMHAIVVDDDLREVPVGEAGELLMTGPQLTMGYWEDAEKTAAAFVVPPGRQEVYYRTGDRVRRDHCDGPLLYLGRVDNQIKVQGYRVELGEIEALIRASAETDVAIAAGYPQGINGAEGIIAFMSRSEHDEKSILARLAKDLPGYMQPRKLITVDEFPLNANGKIDRKALMTAYAEDL